MEVKNEATNERPTSNSRALVVITQGLCILCERGVRGKMNQPETKEPTIWITSPGRDPLFTDLADIIKQCSSENGGCEECPSQRKCLRWWNGVCERSCKWYLSQEAFEKYRVAFAGIKPNGGENT